MKCRAVTIVVLTVCLTASAHADRIYLKNGKSIDGLIIKENSTQVVLDLGVGSTTINRSQIERIEATGGAEETKIRDEWRKKFFLNKKNVPDGLWPLAEEYQQVSAARQEAAKARTLLSNWEATNRRMKSELDEARAKFVTLNRQLALIKPESNVKAYNTLVTDVNAAGAVVTVKQSELENADKARGSASAQVAGYVNMLQTYSSKFDVEKTKYTGADKTPEKTYFFDKLTELVAGMEHELASSVIETRSRNNGTIVSIKINDSITGQFLLDTGASVITISEEMARQLKLDTKGIQQGEVSLADGSKVKSTPVTLASVQLGDAKIADVPAVVLPRKAADDVDGLLGMSFLRNFVIRFDPSNGKLILTRFEPK